MDCLEYTTLPQYAETDAKKAYRTAGGALFAFLIGTQVTAIVLAAIANLFFHWLYGTDWFVLALNFVAIYCVGAPLFFILSKKAPPIPPVKKKMSAGSLICAALIAISCIYVFNIFTVIVTAIIEAVFDFTTTNRLDETLGNANLWLAIISTVVIAPIMEELIFRKTLCDRLAPYGEWQAVIFSALAFSLFHTNLQQMLYAFALGVLFGIIYIRTGNIKYTMILHAIVNFIGSVPGLLLLKGDALGIIDELAVLADGTDYEALLAFMSDNAAVIFGYLIYAVLLFFTVITGVVLAIIFCGKLLRSVEKSPMPKGKRFVIMFTGVFTVLYVVFTAALTVYSLFA